MKIFLRIVKYSALFAFAGILLLTVGAYLNLPLPLKPLVVQSGSMEPTIPVGSLVLVTKKSPDAIGINYVENDIITFRSGKELVSHRVFSVVRRDGVKYFQTKGDANNTVDSTLVAEKDVVGKVNFSVPFVGKFVNFVKQPLGFILLITIPVFFVIVSEVLAIVEEIRKKGSSRSSNLDFAKPLAMFFIAAVFLTGTHAFFSDVVQVSGVSLSTASVFPGQPGSVVINEINWGGSSLAPLADEWVELKNMTSVPIDISGWVIENLGDPNVTIPTSSSIPANGFFLISNYSQTGSRINVVPDFVTTSVELLNSGEQLRLKNSSAVLIDTANQSSGAWFFGAGSSPGPAKSMERKSPPGDGTVSTNWQTATTHTNMDGSNSTDEFGTPKAVNP